VPKNFLKQTIGVISKAKHKDFSSEAIGDFLIMEIVDFGKVEDIDVAKKYFRSKHESIWSEWERRGDFVMPFSYFLDRYEFSRNQAPLSIFPFQPRICVELMLGKIWLSVSLNLSSVMRLFETRRWKIISSIMDYADRPPEQILNDYDIPIFTVRKGPLTVGVPATMIGRVAFEALSPKTLIDSHEEMLSLGPDDSTAGKLV